MPFNHFSRVFAETSWSDLVCANQLQIKNGCKMLEYVELVTISIMHNEFDEICNDITRSHNCYQKYTTKSVATSDGKWKCIIIKDEQSHRKLIFYTGGRIYPLYAAICE